MKVKRGVRWGAVVVLVIAAWTAVTWAAEPQVIELWPEGVPGLKPNAGPEKDDGAGRFTNIHHPTLVVYRPRVDAVANGTAVVFAPGGGYVRVAVGGANGGAITQWLNSLGVTVFLLKYRHADYGQPAPLQDALRAIRVVRSRAAEFRVAPDRIGMLGGSAGAHLTATAATMFNAPEGKTGTELDRVSARPDFAVLVFPVITMMEPHAHAVSRRALLGENPSEELKRRWSAEEQVTKETSPTFIVHAAEDRVAVVKNSLMFYAAMRRAGAPVELHLYTKGPHGSGMDPELGPVSEWPRLCEVWLRANGWLPPKE